MSKKELLKQTQLWYAKLERSGFKDIEWTNGRNVNGQDSPYLKDSAFNFKKKYNEFTAQHYRLMQNYATHATKMSKKEKFIFELYANGDTFREILKKCKIKGGWYAYDNNGKPNLSLFSLHHILKRLIKDAYEWNRTDSEGLLLPESDDDSIY